jgi:hypothetical protein
VAEAGKRRSRPAPAGPRRPRGAVGPVEERPAPVCSVAFCPICTAVTVLGEARPELVVHLLGAGREVLLAIRAAIDARLEGQPPPTRMERIAIG